MEFRIETIAPCKKKVAITISPERVRQELDKKYEEINDAVAMPGFRPGRAPRKLLERRFSTRLAEEMRGDLVKTALDELVEKEKIEFLAPPDIDVEAIEVRADEPVSFEFEAVTKPEFELPAYKDLEVRIAPVSVGGDEIDRAVDQLRRRGASLDTVADSAVEDGDVLIIDWEARDGDSVEAKDQNVYYPYGKRLLAGFYVEDLDEQLAGKAVGETAQTTVQVAADDPREELRGRKLTLDIELKEIKRYVLPAVDAAFLSKHDFDDEAELRVELGKQIQRSKRRGAEHEAEDKLVDQLLAGVEIGIPEDFVDDELEHWASRKRIELQMAQEDEDEIARQVDGGREDARSAIVTDMQRYFLLDRIADAEALEVTENELLHAAQEIAMAYGRPVEEVITSFRDPRRMYELRNQIRHRKVRETLRAAANLIEDPALAGADDSAAKPAAKKKAAKKKAAKKKPAKKKASEQDAD